MARYVQNATYKNPAIGPPTRMVVSAERNRRPYSLTLDRMAHTERNKVGMKRASEGRVKARRKVYR
jgi:hypothetical protein